MDSMINDNMITANQIEGFKDAIKEARKDDTPYIGIDGDELHVLGNPNNTEIKPADYEVFFAFPNTEEWHKRCEQNGDRIGKTTPDGRLFFAARKYKNIYLSPRRAGSVISILAFIESLIYSVHENGEVKELTKEEMRNVYKEIYHEASEASIELISTVLRIPYDEQEWILPIKAVDVAVEMAHNNPSSVNEADSFFELEPDSMF